MSQLRGESQNTEVRLFELPAQIEHADWSGVEEGLHETLKALGGLAAETAYNLDIDNGSVEGPKQLLTLLDHISTQAAAIRAVIDPTRQQKRNHIKALFQQIREERDDMMRESAKGPEIKEPIVVDPEIDDNPTDSDEQQDSMMYNQPPAPLPIITKKEPVVVERPMPVKEPVSEARPKIEDPIEKLSNALLPVVISDVQVGSSPQVIILGDHAIKVGTESRNLGLMETAAANILFQRQRRTIQQAITELGDSLPDEMRSEFRRAFHQMRNFLGGHLPGYIEAEGDGSARSYRLRHDTVIADMRGKTKIDIEGGTPDFLAQRHQ